MTNVEQFVATRLEHLKRQFGDGPRADIEVIKREANKQWDALSDLEKREAERAYFAASLKYERTRKR